MIVNSNKNLTCVFASESHVKASGIYWEERTQHPETRWSWLFGFVLVFPSVYPACLLPPATSKLFSVRMQYKGRLNIWEAVCVCLSVSEWSLFTQVEQCGQAVLNNRKLDKSAIDMSSESCQGYVVLPCEHHCESFCTVAQVQYFETPSTKSMSTT